MQRVKELCYFQPGLKKITPEMYALRWDPKQPLSTPDGLKDEQQAMTMLVNATT